MPCLSPRIPGAPDLGPLVLGYLWVPCLEFSGLQIGARDSQIL